MKTTHFLSAGLAAALSLCAIQAKEPGMGMGRGPMREEMRKIHEKWEQQMKQQDAELDKLQQQIDQSSGQQKMDAVANAVKALIQQRKTMHEQLSSFRERMRGAWEESEASPSPTSSPTP